MVEEAECGAVRLEGVGKCFGQFVALADVDLSVGAGSVTVIFGPSGSGKSTLLRCINGLEMPDSGRIWIAGREITARGADLPGIRRLTGMVFQGFNLFPHLTVERNITLAPRVVDRRPAEETRRTALKLLERVGLPDKIDAYPDRLSGGQQQRVAIARSLAMHPAVMLFDEPTSALDAEMIKEVLDVMVQLAAQGMTMVVVSHEIGFIRAAADMVVFLDEGRIVEQGTVEELFDNPQQGRTHRFLQHIL